MARLKSCPFETTSLPAISSVGPFKNMSERFSDNDKTRVVQPGGTLAILGGGQLGRMMAMAARTVGYHVRVMDPELRCPASFVVDETIVGKWDDAEAAHRLADGADAVTLEIEQIGVDALARVAAIAPL